MFIFLTNNRPNIRTLALKCIFVPGFHFNKVHFNDFRPPTHKRRKGRRIASHSSSSSDDAESLSPLPRVRSIEALEFPAKSFEFPASATIRSVKRAPNWRGQLRHQWMLEQQQQNRPFVETSNIL